MSLAPEAPYGLAATANITAVNLTWTDNSSDESDWIIQRSLTGTGNWTTLATVPTTTGPTKSTTVSYADTPISAAGHYYYQVIASNVVGDTTIPNFPVVTQNSTVTNIVSVDATPSFSTIALSGITATVPVVLDSAGVVQTASNLTVTGTGITIQIPAGARLRSSTLLPLGSMTATIPSSTPAMPIARIKVSSVTFTPNGAVFDLNPVTITWPTNPGTLPQGVLAATATISSYNGAAWVPLTGIVAGANSVSATLAHFTDFALSGAAPSVTLQPGWNTLATPFVLQTAFDTWGELSTAAGLNYAVAYYWNGVAYAIVTPTYVLNPLDAIIVYMNAAGTVPFVPSDGLSFPPSRNLAPGMHLVGSAFTNPTTMPVDQALLTAYGTASLPGYYQVISPTGMHQTPWTFSRNGTPVPSMEFAKGYWVYIANPVTLFGFTTTP